MKTSSSTLPTLFLVVTLLAPVTYGAEPTQRGFLVGTDVGFATPTGYLGFTAGWRWNEAWSTDIGYGWGETGHQLALTARVSPLIGDMRWMLETGPSVALNGPGVGRDIEHEDDIVPSGVYHAAWWNTAIGIEAAGPTRSKQRVFVRLRMGCAARLSENMSPLLLEDSEKYQLSVNSPDVARKRFLPYFAMGIAIRL